MPPTNSNFIRNLRLDGHGRPANSIYTRLRKGVSLNRIQDLTYPEIKAIAINRVLIVAVGATEQHGPHLPVSTNSLITEALVRSLVEIRKEKILLAPSINYGYSAEHAGFAGTLSISPECLEQMLIDVARSASYFAGIGFVTAHGGNTEVISRASSILELGGQSIFSWWPTVSTLQNAARRWAGSGSARGLEYPDLHAGRTETSTMLALAPALVKLDRASAGNQAAAELIVGTLRTSGVGAVAKNGVLGDPTGANASEGSAILGALTDSLVKEFDAFYSKVKE